MTWLRASRIADSASSSAGRQVSMGARALLLAPAPILRSLSPPTWETRCRRNHWLPEPGQELLLSSYFPSPPFKSSTLPGHLHMTQALESADCLQTPVLSPPRWLTLSQVLQSLSLKFPICKMGPLCAIMGISLNHTWKGLKADTRDIGAQ